MKVKSKSASGRFKKYLSFGIGYIIFCFITLFICVLFINNLMKQNSANQLNETIGLIAEKVNVSFDMMSNYVEQEASILSVQENLDLEKEYQLLQNLINDIEYQSIGIIKKDGTLYCSEGERIDLTKYGYDESAIESRELYITEPYLSCVTGSNIITMFAPIYQNNEFAGDLFVTYPLEYVQELAETNVLKHDVESYLMNALSGNYISCSESKNHNAGVWSNINLTKNEMVCNESYDYNTWLANMKIKSDDNVLFYEMDGTGYAQAYISINSMDGWFVVVRMPNIELNNAMHQYLVCISVFGAILMAGTILVAMILFFSESRQKKKLQLISETDTLTGLMNRRAFNTRIAELMKKPNNIAKSAYVFIDIDFFKEVNDNYGHAVGDEILKSVSAIMKTLFHRYGLVARVGGDEFNIFLHNSDRADELIKVYQSEISAIKLSDGTKFPITCSIGIARYRHGDTLERLTERADEALYEVKRNGRNGFCWYDDIKKGGNAS